MAAAKSSLNWLLPVLVTMVLTVAGYLVVKVNSVDSTLSATRQKVDDLDQQFRDLAGDFRTTKEEVVRLRTIADLPPTPQ